MKQDLLHHTAAEYKSAGNAAVRLGRATAVTLDEMFVQLRLPFPVLFDTAATVRSSTDNICSCWDIVGAVNICRGVPRVR